MLDDKDLLPALASAHAQTGGVFNPQLYAIGSSADPEFFLNQHLHKAILASAAQKDARPLATSLTLHHELVHLVQFLSTSFGLRCLLALEAALAALRQGPEHLTLPLINDGRGTGPIAGPLGDLVSLYGREFRFHSGEGAGLSEWRMAKDAISLARLSPDPATARSEFQVLFPSAPTDDLRDVAQRSIAFTSTGAARFRFVDVNAGKLFEAFAVLAELNLLLWLREDLEQPNWADRYLDSMPLEYACVIRIYLDAYGRDDQLLTPMLAALIDLALMYDPELLEPQDAATRNDSAAFSPIDLFWQACDAAQAIDPVTSDDPAEAQRFQDQVSDALHIPRVAELTKRSLKRLEAHMQQSTLVSTLAEDASDAPGPDPRDLSVPFALHRNLLMLRRDLPEAYFWRILDPEFTQQFHDAYHRSINFYDLSTRQRWDDKPWLWMMSSIGNVILDAATKRRVECPLKQGRPYFCNARNDPFGVYCIRQLADGSEFICPFAEFHSKTEVGVDLANRRQWG